MSMCMCERIENFQEDARRLLGKKGFRATLLHYIDYEKNSVGM